MNIQRLFLAAIFALFFSQLALAQMIGDSFEQPSVNRRMIICDSWQWIGNGATTWGCLSRPREASVAHGATTDQVISSLQEQILKLEERIQALENR